MITPEVQVEMEKIYLRLYALQAEREQIIRKGLRIIVRHFNEQPSLIDLSEKQAAQIVKRWLETMQADAAIVAGFPGNDFPGSDQLISTLTTMYEIP